MNAAEKAHCSHAGEKLLEAAGHSQDLADHHEVTDPDASASHAAFSECCKAAGNSLCKLGKMPDEEAVIPSTAGGPAGKSDADRLNKLLDAMEVFLKTTQPTLIRAIPMTAPQLVPRAGQRSAAELAVEPALENIISDPNQA
jgi:hypothetical protein